MATVKIGSPLPSFILPSTSGAEFRSSKAKGSPLILYFYPKDSTAGCTTEAQEFAAVHQRLRRAGVEVLGVSRDSLASHEKFRAKYDLPFHLLSDEAESVCRLFDVIREKNMYGRKVMGIERSTFLFDAKGLLRQEWRKVKAAGHAEQVLEAVRSLD